MRHPDGVEQDGRCPRPQLVRADWCDLSGTWDFAFTDAEAPGEVTFDRRIVVPFPPESPASGIGDPGFHGPLWYRRTFGPRELAAAGLDSARTRLVLLFGAVDHAAEVWLNGTHLGRHEGGQTPFAFDITRVARLEGDNELVVRAVDDPLDVAQPRGKQDWRERPHAIWNERTSGIWQPVWLDAVPEIAVEDLVWSSDPTGSWVDLEAILSRMPGARHLALGTTGRSPTSRRRARRRCGARWS